MKNVLIILIIVVSFSCQTQETSQNNNKTNAIDSLVSYCYENELFNGTILIAQNKNFIYKKAFGYSDYNKTNR